jgi:hypothetical protein
MQRFVSPRSFFRYLSNYKFPLIQVVKRKGILLLCLTAKPKLVSSVQIMHVALKYPDVSKHCNMPCDSIACMKCFAYSKAYIRIDSMDHIDLLWPMCEYGQQVRGYNLYNYRSEVMCDTG